MTRSHSPDRFPRSETNEVDELETSADASVSVIITTFNDSHYLGSALDSVTTQSVKPAEIIVVDDGSSDDPATVTSRYTDVCLIRQSNQGLAAARNTGLRAARGRYVLFLDADD